MALIFRVIGDCTKCGLKDGFGNIGVFGDHVLRGCGQCDYRERIVLPAVRKKVLYLDQVFFSMAFRAEDPRFIEASALIARLASMQLLVVPYSSVHEDETHQWKRYAELLKFIKTVSRGHKFERAYNVPRRQIVKAFRAWLADSPAEYQLEVREGLRDDVNRWEGYFFVDVGGYNKDVDLVRTLKAASTSGLVDLLDHWVATPSSFEQDFQAEYEAAGRGYMDAYMKMMASVGAGNHDAFFNAPLITKIVESMLQVLPETVPPDQRLRRCAEFLMRSAHFRETPHAWLHAHMLAQLRTDVKDGQFANRSRATQKLSGFFMDVEHIATYAPYVDAFFMDKAMAELVSKPGVDLEQRYGVRVFSLTNWDEFLEWLRSIESAGMTPEHQAGLEAAYPGQTF